MSAPRQTAAYQKARTAERRARGLCATCPTPSKPFQCPACVALRSLKYQARQDRERPHRRAYLCSRCRRPMHKAPNCPTLLATTT